MEWKDEDSNGVHALGSVTVLELPPLPPSVDRVSINPSLVTTAATAAVTTAAVHGSSVESISVGVAFLKEESKSTWLINM